MTIFEDRERAFEKRFVRDEETRFRALALRNRMLGQWAAEQLGLTGAAADDYVGEITSKVADAAGDEVVAVKVRHDLAARGLSVSEQQIRHRMSELLNEAIVQIRSSGP